MSGALADPVDVALVIVGCFYALGGFAAARAGLMSHFLDAALEKISMKPVPRAEVWQTRWLLAAAVIFQAGGVALIVRSTWAAGLFLLSALGQLAYVFVVAPYYFDKEEAMDRAGRRQTINAMVVYLAATAFVLWAYAQGRLFAMSDLSWLSCAMAGVLILAMVGYVARGLWMPPRASANAADWDDFDSDGGDHAFDDVETGNSNRSDDDIAGGISDDAQNKR